MAAQRQTPVVSSGNSQRSQYSKSTGAKVNADQSQGYKATEEIDFPSLHATLAQNAQLQNAQRSATQNATTVSSPKTKAGTGKVFQGGLGGQNPYEDESDDDFILVKSSRGNSTKDVPIASPKAKAVNSNVYEVLADSDEETEEATQQLHSTNEVVQEIEEEPDKLPEDTEIAQKELAVGGNSGVEVLGKLGAAANNWVDDSQRTHDGDTLMKTQEVGASSDPQEHLMGETTQVKRA
ncbi:hypothetical protein R1sor_004062 [Riccia sorocarpa]|uniref:Uncharacterized protein n=1 Tax=Riccia sorocarpa TaxID=122646 RepID=A0ABD3H3F2_9MARC